MSSATSPAYEAAIGGLAVFDRADRTLLTVTGRSPKQMLNGVLTGAMPPVPAEVEPGVVEGRATYHAVLTPKGKMISDLVATLLGEDDGPGFLLDVPGAGREALLAHFARFLPPRFAKVTDVSAGSGAEQEWASLAVVGPDAAGVLSRAAFGLRVDASWLEGADEGEWRCPGAPTDGLLAARTGDVWPPAWIVYGSRAAIRSLRSVLESEGAVEGDERTWTTLRVEAGRPAFGPDMTDDTLPPEAGIVNRAIDHAKGCYTGQEVIVRIRDRGHVNRGLRRLDLGDGPMPDPGTELLATDGSGKTVGWLTTVVESPRSGGVLALAYVRREADEVLVGDRTATVPEAFPEPLTG